jgi:hypothetical protein
MKQLDWTAMEAKAAGMTAAQLHYAILDCVKAAENADKLDRAGLTGFEGKSGGYYRDECSVYRRAMAARR